ncbi:protein farnesyltransferase/geranylgeranyltransferase type-1 subunit alpha [Trichinella spiralis]|uniref:protein farnesyltransferase/geranylgeranyltransferase type-1 subunit alpha n=1 Tax=Trichinella spiralis TaxID=6334 RepID=UPI0001EFD05D|nr:protein farnesyltransferase/geranylgeranyltransferase type-1 subunit alpha [Trichinella spiralis]
MKFQSNTGFIKSLTKLRDITICPNICGIACFVVLLILSPIDIIFICTMAESQCVFNSSEFKDVQPIYLSEEESGVINIIEDVYAYFRALFNKQEISERALKLTEEAANLNPANYTVLSSKNTERIEQRFEKRSRILLSHHRRLLIEILNDPTGELEFTQSMLQEDYKNYHAWQHRQWLISHFKLWDNELVYSEEMIKKDARNNSAWNYRYFVINSTTGFDAQVTEREIQMTLENIKKLPHNESAWNYLNGIVEDRGPSSFENVVNFCEYLLSQKQTSPQLLAFLYTAYLDKFQKTEDENFKNKAIKANVRYAS